MARTAEATQAARAAQPAHETRAMDTRAAAPAHAPRPTFGVQVDILHAPAPRPGYVQRWVRTLLNGVEDYENIARQMNQGWQPRRSDTAPDGGYVPSIDFSKYVPAMGNVIGMRGMILMERPIEVDEAFKAEVTEATKSQMDAVRSNLFREHKPGHGLGRPHFEKEESRVTVGRRVEVPED
jgi:hypothetical protein